MNITDKTPTNANQIFLSDNTIEMMPNMIASSHILSIDAILSDTSAKAGKDNKVNMSMSV